MRQTYGQQEAHEPMVWERVVWRPGDGRYTFEVTKGADNVLSEPPVVSPDGSRVAIVVRQPGKRHLAITLPGYPTAPRSGYRHGCRRGY